MNIRDAATPKTCGTVALAEALDRILCRGVALQGTVAIGLADVELIYLDLRVLLGSVDSIWPNRASTIPPLNLRAPSGPPRSAPTHAPYEARPDTAPELSSAITSSFVASPPVTRESNPSVPTASTAQGLVRLVLTVVKLLHDVLERQAVRRMQDDRLTDAQIDRLGAALLAQAEQIRLLQRQFGFSDDDVSLNLGVSDNSL